MTTPLSTDELLKEAEDYALRFDVGGFIEMDMHEARHLGGLLLRLATALREAREERTTGSVCYGCQQRDAWLAEARAERVPLGDQQRAAWEAALVRCRSSQQPCFAESPHSTARHLCQKPAGHEPPHHCSGPGFSDQWTDE